VYLYLYLKHRGNIHLLFLFDKNEQADLTSDQRKLLREAAAQLKIV
jgi:hypothetical protein